MKRKSIIALIIAMIMIVSFTGCGSKEEKSLTAEEILKKSAELNDCCDFELNAELGIEEEGEAAELGAQVTGTKDKNGHFYLTATLAAAGTKQSVTLYFTASDMTLYAALSGMYLKADLQSLFDNFSPMLQQISGLSSSEISALDPSLLKQNISASGKFDKIGEYFVIGQPANIGDSTTIELHMNDNTVSIFTEQFKANLEKEMDQISAEDEAKVEAIIMKMTELLKEVPVICTFNANNEPESVKIDLTEMLNGFFKAVEEAAGEKLDEKCTKAVIELKYANVGKASDVVVPDKIKTGAVDIIQILPYLIQQ